MQLGSNHYSQRDIYDLVVHPFPNFKDSGERPGENISPQYEPILDSYILATSERVFYIGPAGGRELIKVNVKTVITAAELKSYDIITIGSTKLMFVALCGEGFDWNDRNGLYA